MMIKSCRTVLSVAFVAASAVPALAANYLRSGYGESSTYRGGFTHNENWAVGSNKGTPCPEGALHADEDYVVGGWTYLQARDAGYTSLVFGGKSLTINQAYVTTPYATELEFPRDGLILACGGLQNSLDLTLKGKVTVSDSSASLSYYPGFYSAAKGKTLRVTGPIVGSSSSRMAVGYVWSGADYRAKDNYTVRFEGDVSGFTGRLGVLMNYNADSTYAIDAPDWRVKLLVAQGTLATTLYVRDGCYIGVANDNETLTLGGTLYFTQNSGIAVDYAGTTKLDGTLAEWATTPIRILTGKHLDDGRSHSFAAVVAPAGKTFALEEFDIPEVAFAEGTTVEYSIKDVDGRSALWCDVKAEKRYVLRADAADGSAFVRNEYWKDFETGETGPEGALDPNSKYVFDGWKFLTIKDFDQTGKVTFGGKVLTTDCATMGASGGDFEIEFPRDGLTGCCGTFGNDTAGSTVTISGKFTAGKCWNANYPFGFIGFAAGATVRMTADMSATEDSTGVSVGWGWQDRKTSKNFAMVFDCDMSNYDKLIWVRYNDGSVAVTGPDWGAKALFGEMTVPAHVCVEKYCYVGAATAGKTAVVTGWLDLYNNAALAIDNTGILRVDGTLSQSTVTKVLVGPAFNDGAVHSFPAFQAPEGVALDISKFELADTGYFSDAVVSLSVKETNGRSTLWCDVAPIQQNHIRDGYAESTIFHDNFRKNENWAKGSAKGTPCPEGPLDPTQAYFVDGWQWLQIRDYDKAPKVTFGGLFLKANMSLLEVSGDDYELEFPRLGLIGQCGTFRYQGSRGATLTVSGAFRSELTFNSKYPFGFIGTGNKIRLTGPMTASSDSVGISVGRGWSEYNCGENFTVSFEGDLSKFNKRILVQYGDGDLTPTAPNWGAKALFGETTVPGEVLVRKNCYVGAAVDGKTATLTGALNLNADAGLAIDSTGTLKLDGTLTCTKPIRVNADRPFAGADTKKFIAFIAPAGTSLSLSDFDLTAGIRGNMVFSIVEVDGRSALCCEKQGMVVIVR